MRSVSLPAFAKVNLYLNVFSKRPDGYHELETLFERISLADRVHLDEIHGKELEFICSSPEVPSDGTNLVVRAAELFRRRSGWNQGIRILLEKEIPVGGGLGGGSSNAATTLQALQELSGKALPAEELTRCASEIGADVAFFLSPDPWAIGRGRGDEIEPQDFSAAFWHVLVTPDFPIPTKSVYQAIRLSSVTRESAPLIAALKTGKFSTLRGLLYNVLEPVVEGLYPAILNVKSEMKAAGLENPIVSGSGSTVFALCDSQEEAEAAANRLRLKRPQWRVFTASTA